MTPENRNLILAVVLSMIVLFGWQLMVIQPEIEKEQAQQALLAEQQAAKKTLDSAQDVGTPMWLQVVVSLLLQLPAGKIICHLTPLSGLQLMRH